MTEMRQPVILILDDEPDTLSAYCALLITSGHEAQALHPQFVTDAHISGADLILIDYRLTYWPEREELESVSLQPLDGIALASVLRSHVTKDEIDHPVAFALYSANLQELWTDKLAPRPTHHEIARVSNLEYVLQKHGSSGIADQQLSIEESADQISSLARSVVSLPKSWLSEKSGANWIQLAELLSLPSEVVWSAAAMREIERSLPPIHRLSRRSHGLAVLRWLLHRILPYPTFLSSSKYIANRLNISAENLEAALVSNSALASDLASCVYAGSLSEFGPRWWKAGLDNLVWDYTETDPGNLELLAAQLSGKAGFHIPSLGNETRVVCLDEDLLPLGESVPIKEAIRIQPDDWPAFADQAWITLELGRTIPELSALVHPQDASSITDSNAV